MKQLISFHCFFDDDKVVKYQELDIKDIPKWIKAYQFTHPNATAITVKIWLKQPDERREKECVEV